MTDCSILLPQTIISPALFEVLWFYKFIEPIVKIQSFCIIAFHRTVYSVKVILFYGNNQINLSGKKSESEVEMRHTANVNSVKSQNTRTVCTCTEYIYYKVNFHYFIVHKHSIYHIQYQHETAFGLIQWKRYIRVHINF